MAEQTITPDTWKAKTRQSRVVEVKSLGGAKVILRPISAARVGELEVGDDPRKRLAAIVAETAVAGEVEGEQVVSVAGPIWKLADFESEDFPAEVLRELLEIVIQFYGYDAGDEPKN